MNNVLRSWENSMKVADDVHTYKEKSLNIHTVNEKHYVSLLEMFLVAKRNNNMIYVLTTSKTLEF